MSWRSASSSSSLFRLGLHRPPPSSSANWHRRASARELNLIIITDDEAVDDVFVLLLFGHCFVFLRRLIRRRTRRPLVEEFGGGVGRCAYDGWCCDDAAGAGCVGAARARRCAAATARRRRSRCCRGALRAAVLDAVCESRASQQCPRVSAALLLAHTRARETLVELHEIPARSVRGADGCDVITRRMPQTGATVLRRGLQLESQPGKATARGREHAEAVRACSSAARLTSRSEVRALRSGERSAAILTTAGSVASRRASHLPAEERCSTSYKYPTAVGLRRRGFAAVLNDSAEFACGYPIGQENCGARAHRHALTRAADRRRAPPHRPAKPTNAETAPPSTNERYHCSRASGHQST